MTASAKQQRAFPVVGTGEFLAPNYERVVRCLSPAELQADLDNERGDDAYRDAIRAELARREEQDE